MRRRFRGGSDAAPPAPSGWMFTYGNLMMLLLAFFVLLYAWSGRSGSGVAAAPAPAPAPTAPVEAMPLREVRSRLESALKDQGAAHQVKIETQDRWLIIRFEASTLFDSGQVELKERAFGALDAIGSVLATVPNHVRVEGHTDSDPMVPNPYIPDNWILSGHRATSVLRYLTAFHNIDEQRISFAGYASTRPLASNDTPEGKARNRRVEILVAGR